MEVDDHDLVCHVEDENVRQWTRCGVLYRNALVPCYETPDDSGRCGCGAAVVVALDGVPAVSGDVSNSQRVEDAMKDEAQSCCPVQYSGAHARQS